MATGVSRLQIGLSSATSSRYVVLTAPVAIGIYLVTVRLAAGGELREPGGVRRLRAVGLLAVPCLVAAALSALVIVSDLNETATSKDKSAYYLSLQEMACNPTAFSDKRLSRFDHSGGLDGKQKAELLAEIAELKRAKLNVFADNHCALYDRLAIYGDEEVTRGPDGGRCLDNASFEHLFEVLVGRLELALGQADHHGLGELEESLALTSVEIREFRATLDGLEDTVDLEHEGSRDGLGRVLEVRFELHAGRGRLVAASEELAHVHDRAADLDRPIVEKPDFGESRIPVRRLLEVQECRKDIGGWPIDDGRDLEFVHLAPPVSGSGSRRRSDRAVAGITGLSLQEPGLPVDVANRTDSPRANTRTAVRRADRVEAVSSVGTGPRIRCGGIPRRALRCGSRSCRRRTRGSPPS